MRLLREHDVQSMVTMADALVAVEEAFVEQARGTGINQPRQRVHQPNGILHMMGGALQARGYWGFKSYTATRHGIRFSVILYDLQSGAQLALIEADYLGQLRTGAASAVVTEHLARPDARVMALFGTGAQAETQLAAIAQVRQLDEVRAYGRNQGRRETFATRMSQRLNLRVEPVGTPQEAISGADIITTITTARSPLFDGNDIGPGVHINAAGSNSISRTEIDHRTIRRADLIFTDDLVQARQESGDLVMASERNALAWEKVRQVADVVAGIHPGRTSSDQITLFESQGLALWDLALAATVYERARDANIGDIIEFSKL
jgi:ornithine cyclodeaminase/alanine dehydrogenase-like protein (mu-crystallin family)